jgi:hypothetical protein
VTVNIVTSPLLYSLLTAWGLFFRLTLGSTSPPIRILSFNNHRLVVAAFSDTAQQLADELILVSRLPLAPSYALIAANLLYAMVAVLVVPFVAL